MPDIYIGQKSVKALYVGTSPVKAVYVGANLVWSEPPGELGYRTIEIDVNNIVTSASGQTAYIYLFFSDYAMREPIPTFYVNGIEYNSITNPVGVFSSGGYITVKAAECVYIPSVRYTFSTNGGQNE